MVQISHAERFGRLTDWLRLHFELWSARPFVELPVSWEARFPEMARSLRALSPDEIDAVERAPKGSHNLAEPFGSLARQCAELSDWPALEKKRIEPAPRPSRVPGRKWRQIEHFVGAVRASAPADLTNWVDWCSGKGHLGRTLSQGTGVRCRCVEIDPRLCAAGEDEARKAAVALACVCADVLRDDVSAELGEGTGVVALHACGELHMKLLELAASRCRYIALAPCCYHRLPQDRYPPLSEAARKAGFDLTRHHLLLAAYDENIAGAGEKTMRRREQAWRLAVDLLQREGSGVGRYVSLGAVRATWLRGSFRDFALHLQQRRGLDFPPGWDPERAEAHGWERARVVQALALVRGLFRRSLESWAVLDKVLFLQEAGFQVQAGAFCPRDVTPRNLMVVGSR